MSAIADLAKGRLRLKLGQLNAALQGRFTEHHAFLLTQMLTRIDATTDAIGAVDDQITTVLSAELHDATCRLLTIPGVGPVSAVSILAEIGIDMTQFPTAGHLCTWARFAPVTKESAGRTKGNATTGHGNKYLARTLGEVAVQAGKSATFLGARYRRIARRRGKRRALVAVGRSILVAIWHILATPGTTFTDLGADFYESRINHQRSTRTHIRALETLGYQVTLTPAP